MSARKRLLQKDRVKTALWSMNMQRSSARMR